MPRIGTPSLTILGAEAIIGSKKTMMSIAEFEIVTDETRIVCESHEHLYFWVEHCLSNNQEFVAYIQGNWVSKSARNSKGKMKLVVPDKEKLEKSLTKKSFAASYSFTSNSLTWGTNGI